MITVTASNATSLSCLKKFNELAVHKRYPPRAESGGNLRLSNVLHDAMKRLYDPSGGLPCASRIPIYVEAALIRQGGYEDNATRTHDSRIAETILREYLKWDRDRDYTLGVEVSGVFPIQAGDLSYSISARLDRVLCRPEAPDTLVVRDYKIRTTFPQVEAVFINLAVAKLLFPSYRSYTLELDSIGCPEIGFERLEFRSSQMKGMVHLLTDKVRRYADAAALEVYPAESGEHCLFCPLVHSCQAKEAVGAAELDFAA